MDFDMDAAVADIGGGLGFDTTPEASGTPDVELTVAGEEGTTPAEASPEATPAAEKPAEGTTATAPPTDPAAAALEPPKTWRKEAAATWATLPPEAKAEILKREEDIFKGIEGYKAEASFGKSMKSVLAPYEPILRQFNIDPVQQVQGLMNAHYALATGAPEAKVAMLQKLAADYHIDLSQLGGEAPYVDPAVKDLQTRLNAVQSQLSAAEQAQRSQAAATVEKQVAAFAADTNNVYFNEVSDDMVALISKGVVGTLQEAYEKAIWMNPAVRAKETARQQAEASKKAADEATAKAHKAKAALAANVRVRAKTGGAATPLGSLDDTLAEAFAAITART